MNLLTRLLFGEDDRFQLFRYIEVALRSFLWGLFRPASLFVGHDLVTLPYVYPLARIRRRRIVYRAHELWSEAAPNFPMAKFWLSLDKYFSARVDGIVSPEINRAKIYMDEYGAPKLPTVVFNCPRLIKRPRQSPLRRLLAERGVDKPFVVYYQGAIGSTRLVDKLVEAMQYTSNDISLAMVGWGNGDFIDWMNRFIEEHQLKNRIVNLGFVEHGPYLFELCSGADVGVVFAKDDCRNHRFMGTAANKLFEYMMLGVPILASSTPSYYTIVEGELVGKCVDSEDPQSIAAGIMELYQNELLRKELQQSCLRLSKEKYNWDLVFPKLLGLYQELMV
jgi:glycosyltransferase involved in cell wall biosynthesis